MYYRIVIARLDFMYFIIYEYYLSNAEPSSLSKITFSFEFEFVDKFYGIM